MDGYEMIMSRRSIRKYTDEPVSDEVLRKILAAGMSAPSCANTRDWAFIAVRDRETLAKMADANGRPAQLLKEAPAAILVLGDTDRSFPRAKDYWVIDGAAVCENLLLAAHSLGLGAVWLGTWPQMERVEAQAKLFNLPETVIPHSIIALGYPAEDKSGVPHKDYEDDRVHFEKW